MKYFKCVYYNGYCGCDEEFYYPAKNEVEAETIGEEYLQDYSFAEPDSSFIDMDDEDEVQAYYDNVSFYVVEISKEEFKENA